jgi:D-alanyl-D-alanine dipeptidase
MSERSHPDLETQLLALGQITRQHVANRELLRSVMLGAGFTGIANEWWHFDCGDSWGIRAAYQRIL